MRKIKDLMTNSETVWFYLGEDKSLRDAFSKEVNEMGYSFFNCETVISDQIGRIMAVHANGNIAHVSLMAWAAAFKPGDGSCGFRHNFDEIPKIDYEKYIAGYPSYLMESCNFKRIL